MSSTHRGIRQPTMIAATWLMETMTKVEILNIQTGLFHEDTTKHAFFESGEKRTP